MAISASGDQSASRRRRAHKKSRRGCANCKLRRVKCSEESPACHKCKVYGIACTYDGKTGDGGFKFVGESSFSLDSIEPRRPVGPNEPAKASAPVATVPREIIVNFGDVFFPDTSSSDETAEETSTEVARNSNDHWWHGNDRRGLLHQLSTPGRAASFDCAKMIGYQGNRGDWDLMQKFRDQTILTVGHPKTSLIYQREVVGLSFSHPFLNHIVLTLSSIYDRYLHGVHDMDSATTMHWCRGTTLFKDALSNPACSQTKDALWASAALLGAIQFAAFEPTTPYEAWPLKPYDPRDLDWLRMSDGKKAVWKITDPTRPDSVFRDFSRGNMSMFRPLSYTQKELIHVHRDFSELFNLGPDSSGKANPYHQAALSLARLLDADCNQTTIMEFFSFIGHVHPVLKDLLDNKDPKALLLVACWFAKVYTYQWWIRRRGYLEGQAICIYLDRYHQDDVRIQRLLEWPRAAFGMPTREDEGGREGAEVLCML